MPVFTVLHAKNPTFTEKVQLPINEHYIQVADVHCDNIDDAYRLTNHIDEAWQLNEEVQNALQPARSTSVGDLVKTEDGTIFICASFGWKQISV